jgi:hypothetical protein
MGSGQQLARARGTSCPALIGTGVPEWVPEFITLNTSPQGEEEGI